MPRKSKKRSKRLPINLLRKRLREQRHVPGIKKRPRKHRKLKMETERMEHKKLFDATLAALRKILQANDVLSDIPCDYTPEELLGEIAIADDYATTIYIKRDGLCTLSVVLYQKNPTIANLKRAIELTARAQHKRELRERYESRRKRRRLSEETGNMSDNDNDSAINIEARNQIKQQKLKRRQQQLETTTAWLMANRSTGEFIHSTTRCGHPHRTTVSWRFLWRAYMLIDVENQNPLYDEDGRKLLIDCGIENGATLRFCKREIYLKRLRQKKKKYIVY